MHAQKHRFPSLVFAELLNFCRKLMALELLTLLIALVLVEKDALDAA